MCFICLYTYTFAINFFVILGISAVVNTVAITFLDTISMALVVMSFL